MSDSCLLTAWLPSHARVVQIFNWAVHLFGENLEILIKSVHIFYKYLQLKDHIYITKLYVSGKNVFYGAKCITALLH